jgi:23S rRNA pseudouridine1911/1915/1917 synthase
MRTAILYSDSRLIAVNKPPGISLATPKADPHAAVGRLLDLVPPDELAAHCTDREQLRLVHRLDTGTSGVVLLAQEPESHSALIQMFSSRQVRKTYLALVWGHPRKREGVFDSPIGPDRRDRRRMRADPKGRVAVSRYRTRAIARYVSLLELMPETGRTHQIRVHLSHEGHWIVGDDLYAGPRHHAVRETALAGRWTRPICCCTRGSWNSPLWARSRLCSSRRPSREPSADR